MLTFTGAHVTKEFGAPSIRDIAIQSMRIVRFSGAGRIFWPIGMHMMLVADLCATPDDPWLEVFGLLHDAAEVCVADVPVPMKTDAAREIENNIQSRIHVLLGVPCPTAAQKTAVKAADRRAAFAEGAIGCGPECFKDTQTGFAHDLAAEIILTEYLRGYQACGAIDEDGRYPREYEKRLRVALRKAQHSERLYGGACG